MLGKAWLLLTLIEHKDETKIRRSIEAGQGPTQGGMDPSKETTEAGRGSFMDAPKDAGRKTD